MKYSFKKISNCNMCGSTSEHFVVKGKRLNKPQGFKPQKKVGITTTVVKCKKCDLIFSNPMPIPQNIQDRYGVPVSDYWTSEYFNKIKKETGDKIFWESHLGKIHPNFTSLDIGAGIGKHMVQMQHIGANAYGIEPSETFYQNAIDKTGISTKKLQLSTIEDAIFEDNFFDFINFGVVLEHLENPSKAINKAMKWLKPGGKIMIEVPNSNWLISKILNFSYKIRGLDYVTNLSPMHKPYHLYEFASKSFELNSSINEYKVNSISYFVCETFLPKILDPFLKPIMRWTNTGMQLGIWLEKPSI